MTREAVDYFSNHRLKLRFPWSLYHRPIIEELGAVLRASAGTRVLNIGSGPFFELPALGCEGKRFTLCDIDARAVDLARELHGGAVERADLIAAGAPLPYDDESFDTVVSMDVIEHVPDPLPWVREALRVLRGGGLLFVTTPNYASSSLRFIENTVLEVVARRQGWSRRTLHPTKLDARKIGALLQRAGLECRDVKSLALGWVLAASGRK